ncbi:hypothetical protein FA10DRAFT_261429 [Acaromyces ingoldii]|uniref:Uncharacterized protein n=1 Tax=Acaromyces ingoldii TaxID=215250 RepID=A0A316YPI7_9BASI|nr:hypothetical protein FA10DRAFT_261429 [Acaromyces ingoldii]PWN89655.1 hypothetical protein FA10DRAFT_261429 [Acaromyces ingoldii]
MRKIVASAALLASLLLLSMIGLATTTAAHQHDKQFKTSNNLLGQLYKRADSKKDKIPSSHPAQPTSSAPTHELPSHRSFEDKMQEEKLEESFQKLLLGNVGSGSGAWGRTKKRTPKFPVENEESTALTKNDKPDQPLQSDPPLPAPSSPDSSLPTSESDFSPPGSPMQISGAEDKHLATRKGKGVRSVRQRKEDIKPLTRFIKDFGSKTDEKKKKKRKKDRRSVFKLMCEDDELPEEFRLTESEFEARRKSLKFVSDWVRRGYHLISGTLRNTSSVSRIKHAEKTKGLRKNVLTTNGLNNTVALDSLIIKSLIIKSLNMNT